MPPETAEQLTPEQRMDRLFQQGGEGVLDGVTPVEDRMPDVLARGASRGVTPAGTEELDKGPADPGIEDRDENLRLTEPEAESEVSEPEAADPDAESAETGDEQEGSQEQEGIDAAVLAQVLGIEDEGIAVDEEGRPLFTVKVDGENRSVALPELLRGYSGQEVFTRKSMQLSEERQQFEQQKQQELDTFTTKAQVVDQVLAEHQEEVLAQYNQENWEELRRTRPDEFAARRTEYAELYQKIGQRRQAVQHEVVQAHQKAQEEMLQKRQEFAIREGQELRSKVKEWDTDEKAAKGAQAIDVFLRETYGFTPEDLANTTNHRAYLVALDAMQWRLQQKQEPVVRQRVVKAPKVLKPGVPTTAGERKRVTTARVVKRHKAEQTVDTAAEAFLAKGLI